MDEVLKPNLREDIQKLAGLIQGIKIAMMTTLDETGRMHSRPMITQHSDFDGNLWFFTKIDSPKIDELQWNRQVHLNYVSPDESRFISISGTGEVVRDRKKAEQLWNPGYKAWFPDGIEDPDLVLLCVNVDRAEYWDSSSNEMVEVLGMAKPGLTRESYQGEAVEHRKIDLSA